MKKRRETESQRPNLIAKVTHNKPKSALRPEPEPRARRTGANTEQKQRGAERLFCYRRC